MSRDSSLILGVVKSDLQTCIDILSEGCDANIVTGDGSPLLHLAVALDDADQAFALTQLLLVHGADPNVVNQESNIAAVGLSKSLGRKEISDLLTSFGAKLPNQNSSHRRLSRKFQNYVFDDQTNDSSRGNKFLEKVASLFEDNIKGVTELSPAVDVNTEDPELAIIGSQLSSAHVSSFLRPPKPRHGLDRMCSTPTRSHPPSLNVSLISSVGPAGDLNTSSCTVTDSSQDMFHSCLSNCDLSKSFNQKFLVEDPEEGISFIEEIRSSMLSRGERNVSKGSIKTAEDVTLVVNSFINTSTSNQSCSQKFDMYPRALADSLVNISKVTKRWKYLSSLEAEMSEKFNSLSTSQANLVNQLTRETACKSSFNYLLLDPTVSNNLPLQVYIENDQELWRRFVKAIFYVGKGSRSRPFQHLYEAIKSFKKDQGRKKLSDKIRKIHNIWNNDRGVVVVQVFQNTIAVEAFTREAAMIDALSCDNITNLKPGDYYGVASQWQVDKKLDLGTFLLFKSFKIFLQEGERQIRPVDLKS